MSRPKLRLLPGGQDTLPDREPVPAYVTVVSATVMHLPPRTSEAPPRFVDTHFEVTLSNGDVHRGSGRSLRDIVPHARHEILKHANAHQRAEDRPLIEYDDEARH